MDGAKMVAPAKPPGPPFWPLTATRLHSSQDGV